MGKWEKQLEVIKESKEKEKISRETLGKFFYDLAKTSFTVLRRSSSVRVSSSKTEEKPCFAKELAFKI